MVAQKILKKFFFVNDYKLEAAVDVNKCLEQVELHKFTSHVRFTFWATIFYKNHDFASKTIVHFFKINYIL